MTGAHEPDATESQTLSRQAFVGIVDSQAQPVLERDVNMR